MDKKYLHNLLSSRAFFSVKKIQIALMVFFFSMSSFAQQNPPAPTSSDSGGDGMLQDSLNDLKTIGYAGLGGAILGLSTLSFVDHPKDNLRNVWVGGAVGIIVGVAFVAYFQANKTNAAYWDQMELLNEKKNSQMADSMLKPVSSDLSPFSLQYTHQF